MKLYVIRNYMCGQHQGEDWERTEEIGYYIHEENARKELAHLLETDFFDYDAVPDTPDSWDNQASYSENCVSGFTDSTLTLEIEETED